MKSLFHSHITFLLLALCVAFSSCERETIAPSPAASAGEANHRPAKVSSGNYIVQFKNNSALQLNTNADIEALAEQIACAQLTFTDIFNFEGFKGFACYLTKQQARRFYSDPRVLVIEPDTPIGPLTAKPETETENETVML